VCGFLALELSPPSLWDFKCQEPTCVGIFTCRFSHRFPVGTLNAPKPVLSPTSVHLIPFILFDLCFVLYSLDPDSLICSSLQGCASHDDFILHSYALESHFCITPICKQGFYTDGLYILFTCCLVLYYSKSCYLTSCI